ncbi:hypothetical protein [Longimicrobium sp.]|uniref:hypothetical protein n=1 Tax=Longimicrobium sp. TaxID=2029185 RepID=UPI002E2F60F9|nr:hypothetical protein [Longimicrobium sp.]HEX6041782.1 hypothetical protein [Longimicrobium sp.]
MLETQQEVPEAQQRVPEWVVRLRAAGYNVRIGTLDEPLPEIPEAFFYPPPSASRRLAERLSAPFRKLLRTNASTRPGHAPLP